MIGKKLFTVLVLGVLGTLVVIGAAKFLPIQKLLSDQTQSETPGQHGPVTDITTVDQFTKVLKSKKPMIIKFHADWCGACNYVKGPFAELAHEHSHINFYEVNVDNEDIMNYADEHKVAKDGVEGLPTFVFRHNDKVNEQVVGGKDKKAMAKDIKKFFS
ncbi:MAG: thiol-disulfide isomerase/thioredoxin [Alteromonas naphthalenivorans]